MINEDQLAHEAYHKMRNADHEAYVSIILESYFDRIQRAHLNRKLFIQYLKQRFSILCNSQTPEQTNRNTMAALALLQGKK